MTTERQQQRRMTEDLRELKHFHEHATETLRLLCIDRMITARDGGKVREDEAAMDNRRAEHDLSRLVEELGAAAAIAEQYARPYKIRAAAARPRVPGGTTDRKITDPRTGELLGRAYFCHARHGRRIKLDPWNVWDVEIAAGEHLDELRGYCRRLVRAGPLPLVTAKMSAYLLTNPLTPPTPKE